MMALPFDALCRAAGLPVPEAEVPVVPGRRFRWDWAWKEHRVALEVQGGVWTRGRHTRGAGYSRDTEKLNEGQLAGWLVLYATTQQVSSGQALEWVRRALEVRQP